MVVDANVLVSGVLSPKGAPALVLNAWRERRFLMVLSPGIITEVQRVLQYSHIREKYRLTSDEIDQIILLFEHDALLVNGEIDVSGEIPADPTDEMFLACALEGQAELIVSGDHHLLDLGRYQGIPIITARQFLERLDLED